MIMQGVMNATEVRVKWGAFIDGVVRSRPEFVKRNRDLIAALSLDHLALILNPYVFHLEYRSEEDGSVSGALSEVDLVANAPTLNELKLALAQELVEYAHEYLEEYDLYSRAPNRKSHFPYILRVLVQKDVGSVASLIHA